MATTRIAQHASKLFVGNLPWTIGNKQLKEYFAAFGHVNSAFVVFDRETGMSRGYGFVDFALQEAHEAASKQKIHLIEGKAVKIEDAAATVS